MNGSGPSPCQALDVRGAAVAEDPPVSFSEDIHPILQMPHGKRKLSTCDRDLIRSRIKAGARDN